MRAFHRREMQSVLEDPVAFTLRSPRYRVDPARLSLTLSISEDGTLGQSPADYLAPVFRDGVSTRGKAVTTRFSRQLQRVGQISSGTHLVPNTKARLAETRRGRISSRQYQTALSYLKGNIYAPHQPKAGERYFAIDTTSSSPLKPGVYRAKGIRSLSSLRFWMRLLASPEFMTGPMPASMRWWIRSKGASLNICDDFSQRSVEQVSGLALYKG